jgi:hypothetical protein
MAEDTAKWRRCRLLLDVKNERPRFLDIKVDCQNLGQNSCLEVLMCEAKCCRRIPFAKIGMAPRRDFEHSDVRIFNRLSSSTCLLQNRSWGLRFPAHVCLERPLPCPCMFGATPSLPVYVWSDPLPAPCHFGYLTSPATPIIPITSLSSADLRVLPLFVFCTSASGAMLSRPSSLRCVAVPLLLSFIPFFVF